MELIRALPQGWLMPLLCAAGCGVLSSWGVGGGTLLLVCMTLFLGVEQRTAQGINLLFFLPTALPALVCHARAGLLDRTCLRSAVPAALGTALLGAVLATVVDPAPLRRPFGAGLLLCGLRMLWGKKGEAGQKTVESGNDERNR